MLTNGVPYEINTRGQYILKVDIIRFLYPSVNNRQCVADAYTYRCPMKIKEILTKCIDEAELKPIILQMEQNSQLINEWISHATVNYAYGKLSILEKYINLPGVELVCEDNAFLYFRVGHYFENDCIYAEKFMR